MTDAEEQAHHTLRATFPPLTSDLPCIWPPEHDVTEMFAGLEEEKGTKQEALYLKSFHATAMSSLPPLKRLCFRIQYHKVLVFNY